MKTIFFLHVPYSKDTKSLLLVCTFQWSFFQNCHDDCHSTSPCKMPNYEPSKAILTALPAIEAYEKELKGTLIFRYAGDYARVSCIRDSACVSTVLQGTCSLFCVCIHSLLLLCCVVPRHLLD